MNVSSGSSHSSMSLSTPVSARFVRDSAFQQALHKKYAIPSLHAYQHKAIRKVVDAQHSMRPPFFILGHPMGQGKTLMSLYSAFSFLVEHHAAEPPVMDLTADEDDLVPSPSLPHSFRVQGREKKMLIVAPLNSIHPIWMKNVQRWAELIPGIEFDIYHNMNGDRRHPDRVARFKRCNVIITNFESIGIDLKRKNDAASSSSSSSPVDTFNLFDEDWEVMIVDEVHKVRNLDITTKKSKYNMGVTLLALRTQKVKFTVMLTGTLLNNKRKEVMSYIHLGLSDKESEYKPSWRLKGHWKGLSDFQFKQSLESFYVTEKPIKFCEVTSYTVRSVLTEAQMAKMNHYVDKIKSILEGEGGGGSRKEGVQLRDGWALEVLKILGKMRQTCHGTYVVRPSVREIRDLLRERMGLKRSRPTGGKAQAPKRAKINQGEEDGEVWDVLMKMEDEEDPVEAEPEEDEYEESLNDGDDSDDDMDGVESDSADDGKESERKKAPKEKRHSDDPLSTESIKSMPTYKVPWKRLSVAQIAKWCAKSESFVNLLRQHRAENRKVVIFCEWFRGAQAVADIITSLFPEQEPLFYNSYVSVQERHEAIEKFQDKADTDHSFILCGVRSGSDSIELTAGSAVHLFDPWWNPSQEAQALCRVARQGQTRDVQVFRHQSDGVCVDTFTRSIQDNKWKNVSSMGLAAGVHSSEEYNLLKLTSNMKFKDKLELFLEETFETVYENYRKSCKTPMGKNYELLCTDGIPNRNVDGQESRAESDNKDRISDDEEEDRPRSSPAPSSASPSLLYAPLFSSSSSSSSSPLPAPSSKRPRDYSLSLIEANKGAQDNRHLPVDPRITKEQNRAPSTSNVVDRTHVHVRSNPMMPLKPHPVDPTVLRLKHESTYKKYIAELRVLKDRPFAILRQDRVSLSRVLYLFKFLFGDAQERNKLFGGVALPADFAAMMQSQAKMFISFYRSCKVQQSEMV